MKLKVGDKLKAKQTLYMGFSDTSTFLTKDKVYTISLIENSYYKINSDFMDNHTCSFGRIHDYFEILYKEISNNIKLL